MMLSDDDKIVFVCDGCGAKYFSLPSCCECVERKGEETTFSRYVLSKASQQAHGEQSIDDRMKAAGMLSVAELLKGAPLDGFMKHAGVRDLDSLLQWAEMRRGECLRTQAAYDTGSKEQDDMYEWAVAHCAVFTELHVNLRAAIAGEKSKAMPIPKQEPEIAFQFKHIETGQIKSVSLSYEEIQEKLTDDLYDELGATICQCESIGETNVVECNCDSYFEKFELTGYVPLPAQAIPERSAAIKNEKVKWLLERKNQRNSALLAASKPQKRMAFGAPSEDFIPPELLLKPDLTEADVEAWRKSQANGGDRE